MPPRSSRFSHRKNRCLMFSLVPFQLVFVRTNWCLLPLLEYLLLPTITIWSLRFLYYSSFSFFLLHIYILLMFCLTNNFLLLFCLLLPLIALVFLFTLSLFVHICPGLYFLLSLMWSIILLLLLLLLMMMMIYDWHWVFTVVVDIDWVK